MCRIAGILHPGKPLPELEQIVQSMCELLKHGGPDDGGTYSAAQQHLVLGNRRLALQDLSPAGHMPMQYAARYTITFNGEIYNFKELKEELQHAGQVFHNGTDTEVIMAAYDQWEMQCFTKFKGMFALAIWDVAREELILARDAAGMKPLYYSTHTGGIAFASEMRAFSVVPWLQQANDTWPIHLLAYGHIPEPVTTLQHVQPLPKGCTLTYRISQGNVTLRSFKHYSYTSEFAFAEPVKALIREQLEQSVKRHLVADTPIGCFLSGGLDSSIIASLASKQQAEKLISLSIYFKEGAFSEKPYQDIMINSIGCSNNQWLLEEADFHKALPTIFGDMDMPSCDGINTWFISRCAKESGLKAVLTGIGGDELLGGYPSFNRMELAGRLHQLSPHLLDIGQRSRFKKLNRLSYLKMRGIKGLYLFLRGHFTPVEIARQLDMDEHEVWSVLNELPNFNDISDLTAKNQASWMEFNLYLQNQLLRDADVMGMAHGIEIRVPFLDDDFIRLCTHISSAVKYNGKSLKPLLGDSFRHLIPAAILNRPKMGFAFPFADWMKQNQYVRNMSEGTSRNRDNYERFVSGKLHWSQMMTLLLIKERGL